MLYPKEDRVNNTLMFACRTCTFSEPAGTSCIYRNSLKETIAETPGNVQDVADDPTVGNTSASFDDDDTDSMMYEMEDAEGGSAKKKKTPSKKRKEPASADGEEEQKVSYPRIRSPHAPKHCERI